MKWDLLNFDSNNLTSESALFPIKNSRNIAKSNRIVPGKGRRDRALSLTYLDSPMAEVFPNTAYFLWFFGVKVGLKVQILGPLVFHRSSNPSKTFQAMFLFPQVGGFGPFIWESKGPKSPNKRNFMDAESVRKTLDYVSS